ncbi:PqqD family protein [Bacillus wiedmannii]|uniref:PqqD family peptide modification chaperone n=1 Tax=Bacillus wiedmannii TaxID=1890302 RepID=UPI000BFA8E72|nr:PqqD family peptide modification chaperone [Bacillus wiedmannii]PGD05844.1 PqqD family protein [Bacillus wiedmannii]PGE25270.1 PqqD family protein [Bacillus wiedmannii]
MKGTISEFSRIIVKPGTIISEFEGEAVLLNISQGIYYGIDEVGLEIWKLIVEKNSLGVIKTYLVNNYDITKKELSDDTERFIENLYEKGLIEIK